MTNLILYPAFFSPISILFSSVPPAITRTETVVILIIASSITAEATPLITPAVTSAAEAVAVDHPRILVVMEQLAEVIPIPMDMAVSARILLSHARSHLHANLELHVCVMTQTSQTLSLN